MNPAKKLFTVIAVFSLITSCGVLKKDDPEKEARAFLTRFQSSLTQPTATVIKQFFKTKQAKDVIFDALIVLQNKDSAGIKCAADFQLASLTFYEQRIEVKVPVSFKENLSEENHVDPDTYIILWLERSHNEYFISEIDGAAFYQTYTAVKNSKLWAAEYQKELKLREPFYKTADSLEQFIDSVIWYAHHNNQQYYYAVSGSWENYFINNQEEFEGSYAMGMIDAKGDTLIPFEYELIGTIGFDIPSVVEVKRDGKYGYFHLDSGKLIIEPKYDMIVPYGDSELGIMALVLNDTTYGWINTAYEYSEGYPSADAMTYMQDYWFLKDKIVLKAGNQVFCEIPAKDHVGYGIVIPPSYYVKNKVFSQIVGGINTTAVPMNGWTDYVENSKSMVARIGEGIQALISVLSERYIGGREEFYGSSQVTFVNENEDVIGTTEMPTDQEVVFTHIGDGVLELKAIGAGYHYYTPGNERDIPVYKYFQIEDQTTLNEMSSSRIFNFMEFVKIDSSYITGTFALYDHSEGDEVMEEEVVYEEPQEEVSEQEGGEEGESTEGAVAEETYEEEYYEEDWSEPVYEYIDILTLPTLRLMRDEILAVNGCRPQDYENARRFENNGYSMTTSNPQEIVGKLNEIDQHNLKFLNKVIQLIEEGTVEDSEADEGGI